MIFNGLTRLIEGIKNFKFNKIILTIYECGFMISILDYLLNIQLNLDIWAVEDGTVVFANEPLLLKVP